MLFKNSFNNKWGKEGMEHGERNDVGKNVCLSAFRSYPVVLLDLERYLV